VGGQNMGKYYFIVILTRFGPVILAKSECIDVVIAIAMMKAVCRCDIVSEE
jgi:hypothetical protein